MKYFQHDTDTLANRKIRKVIRIHGVTGYAIWWAVLENLYKADSDGFLINADLLWLEDLAEQLKITDYRTLIRVLDTFAEVGLICSQMWADHILYCHAIAERGDRYIQRKAYERDKKRRQRELKKAVVPDLSPGTKGQNHNVPTSYTDPDPNTEELIEITKDHVSIVDSQSESTANAIAFESEIDVRQEILEPTISNGQVSEESEQCLGVNSGSAPNKSQAEKKAEAEAEFIALYNAKKPAKWTKLQVLNSKRKKMLRTFCQEMGGHREGLDAIAGALTQASRHEWFSKHKLSFEQFFSNGKPTQLFEQFLESQQPTDQGGTSELPSLSAWLDLIQQATGGVVSVTKDPEKGEAYALVEVGDRVMPYKTAVQMYPVHVLKRRIEAVQKISLGSHEKASRAS